MYVRVTHASGKVVLVPASQVVVYADNGLPVAITYEREKLIVHTDRNQSDFDATTHDLGIGAEQLV